MKWSKLKEETIENIKVFSISGILVVAFYTLINNVEPLFGVLQAIFVALSPFIYGIGIAFLLNPLRKIIEYSWLGKTKLKPRTKKIIASFGALFIGIIMLFVFFSILIPQMISSIQTFLSSFEGYVDSARNFFESNNFFSDDLLKTLNPVIDKGVSMLGDWVSNLASSLNAILMYSVIFAKSVMNFLIGMIIALYILLDEVNLKRQMKKVLYALLPEKTTKGILRTTRLTINTFNSFVAGKAVDSLIIGILCYIILSFMKMPYTPLISVVVGVTNMIPVFGPFLGAVPSILILLLVDPFKALEFSIFILILQQVDGNIIGPRILGGAVGLPTLYVMFAIIIGGALFGIVGMFIGVPVFSVIFVLVSEFIHRQLDKKNITIQ
ncbi:MAG: AI-2E family transporter [Solobacterium sp.]|jgi:putative membrane protein|uniref:AI-2E family transporter n=1 Tax=Solobacterium sp. TaxID=2060878 RepID=UPI001CACC3EF|nr:AI-2E family transporter [Solobacterium sp.]MBF1085586.1 AI-2E family transporter [Solobacterium sp.]MBF1089642.1 AI-2E family transporter [Solobacterium sp.]MBF1091102.1 AI-2E family transporter [Solobacterium sp.]MBF1101710.1 AI-2E family transporter [Solobacterium sp.]MBF1103116.1 AI-2E family transporter [Solobacterium sp.]